MSNEGGSSPLLVLLPAVTWPPQPSVSAGEFVRIAHLSALASHHGIPAAEEPTAAGSETERSWLVGAFGACPVAQRGVACEFSEFTVGPRKPTVHEGDAGDMV